MNINSILKEVLTKINPSKEEVISIEKYLKEFTEKLKANLHKIKASADIFVGGSFAKKTIIRKGQYDIDIFVRFDEKHRKEDISKITERALKSFKNVTRIHGSRDYFKINVNPVFFIEIIPVMKVKSPKEAGNITDLSYFHVNYIKKKLKTEKMLEEVRLAKAFSHAKKCYGAESYINGFSGYAIELLICHYKSFLNFVKKIANAKEKEIIDIEKLYRNNYEVAINMNSAKMNSPIVLIDPTYRERNALAALSRETFEKFGAECRKFLKSPTIDAFEAKKENLEAVKKNAKKNRAEFILIKAETDKQEGDIAGSKLAKFYKHLAEEIEKYYIIKHKGFEYSGGKDSDFFFVARSRKEIIQLGPLLRDKENVKIFRKHHKQVFIKNKRTYAREKVDKDIKKFIIEWTTKNYDKMKAMNIEELKILDYS